MLFILPESNHVSSTPFTMQQSSDFLVIFDIIRFNVKKNQCIIYCCLYVYRVHCNDLEETTYVFQNNTPTQYHVSSSLKYTSNAAAVARLAGVASPIATISHGACDDAPSKHNRMPNCQYFCSPPLLCARTRCQPATRRSIQPSSHMHLNSTYNRLICAHAVDVCVLFRSLFRTTDFYIKMHNKQKMKTKRSRKKHLHFNTYEYDTKLALAQRSGS